jgi:hypothetical protein
MHSAVTAIQRTAIGVMKMSVLCRCRGQVTGRPHLGHQPRQSRPAPKLCICPKGADFRFPETSRWPSTGPSGVSAPKFIQSVGDSTAVNQDVHVTAGMAHIPAAGDYTIAADGKASAYLSPRLSFGHGRNYEFLTWAFVALGGASLLVLLGLLPAAVVCARRVAPPKRKTALQQLDDIAALHNSGALPDEEYEAANRQLLDGL